MPDLETLLRDVRPAPDPAWAARLDARAGRGFPRPRRFARLRANLIVLPAGALAAALVALVLVAARGDHGGSGDSGSASSASAPAAEALQKSAAGASDSASSGSAASGRAAAPAQPLSAAGRRDVLRNAQLTLTAPLDDVDDVADRAIRAVDALGGFVADSSTRSSATGAQATLSLQIPAAKLAQGLAQLSRLGHVKDRSQQAEDVTDQRSALEAAVRDARADRAGLRRRLAKAATDAERSHLRAQLQRAARRITARERAVSALSRQVSYATVDLTVQGTRRRGAAAPGGRWTPGDALGDAARVLEVGAGVALIALAVGLPLVFVGGLGTFAGRRLARRRRERALETA